MAPSAWIAHGFSWRFCKTDAHRETVPCFSRFERGSFSIGMVAMHSWVPTPSSKAYQREPRLRVVPLLQVVRGLDEHDLERRPHVGFEQMPP